MINLISSSLIQNFNEEIVIESSFLKILYEYFIKKCSTLLTEIEFPTNILKIEIDIKKLKFLFNYTTKLLPENNDNSIKFNIISNKEEKYNTNLFEAYKIVKKEWNNQQLGFVNDNVIS